MKNQKSPPSPGGSPSFDPYGSSKIRDLLAEKGLRLSKDRGQNYLIHRAAAQKIVDALPPLQGGQIYFEVGSGLGALTLLLAEKGPVISLEIDRGIHTLLSEKLSLPNLELVHGDFLSHPLPKDTPYLWISNLPYSISGEALKVFIEEPCFSEGVVMLQREFAQRIAAPAGTPAYGPLSVIAQTFLEIEKLFTVGRGSFFPEPKVDSQVLRLRKKPQPLWGTTLKEPLAQAEFGRFVKTLFTSKRKTLANNIAQSPWAGSALAQSPHGALRPEKLSPAQWVELFDTKNQPQ